MSAATCVKFDLNGEKKRKKKASLQVGLVWKKTSVIRAREGIAVCACGNTAQNGECVREARGDRYSRAVMSEAVELLSSCHYLKHPHITIIMAFN